VFRFPDELSADDFLDRYWQKSPLFMPDAIADAIPELTPDELAWLATLDDVESRVIFTDAADGESRYRVEQGPFDEKTLSLLPEQDWTLLVQDVDKHLPVFRKLLGQAGFIPDWRVDDVMVSLAMPGGGVGPHRDNYDVFLCQGSGSREWRVAPRNAESATVAAEGLSLLEPFADDSPVISRHGDVLYLPPGTAHWGVAIEACVTYSTGMRAPTLSEFVSAMKDVLDIDLAVEGRETLFYNDPDLGPDEADPGRISDRALSRARRSFSCAADLPEIALATVFGSLVTDTKAWLTPDVPGNRDIEEFLASGKAEVAVHGMARLAYFAGQAQSLVFVNGAPRNVSAPEIELFKAICRNRSASVEDSEFFRWLLAEGTFDFPWDEQTDAT
jgi:50S ribosomal protein L16 3-hydroxylase